MANYFPEEIWYEILKRLPSKSLCRFISVSKPWCRLITTQSFISSHLNQNLHTQTNTHLFLRVFQNHHDENNDNEEEEKEDFLFYNGEQSIILKFPLKRGITDDIVGTCNGLVCLTTNNNSQIILWNPSIHKFVNLPEFSLESSCEGWVVLGFGANLINGDFKVLRVFANSENVFALVYSHQTGKWVEIKEFSCNIDHLSRGSHLYLNGRSHFIGKLRGDVRDSIISFDMSDEVFRQVPIPEDFDGKLMYHENPAKLFSMTLKEKEEECLAITVTGLNVFRWIETMGVSSIWVMKEYGVLESWTKLYNIDLGWPKIHTILGFMKNGNVLQSGKRKQLICFDPPNELVSKFDIFGSRFHAEKYMESLVLLEQPHFNNYDVESLTTTNFIQLN